MDRTSLLTLTGTDPSRSLQRAMLAESPVPRPSEERGTSAQDQLDFLQQLRAPQNALNMSAPITAPERQGLQLSDLSGHPPSPFQMTQFQLERPAMDWGTIPRISPPGECLISRNPPRRRWNSSWEKPSTAC